MHPLFEEICRTPGVGAVQPMSFNRWQRLLRPDIQPMLDELEQLRADWKATLEAAQATDAPSDAPEQEAVPVLEQPGERHALQFAEEHGFPIMIKAVAGGGGRGIRVASDVAELVKGLKMARSEAKMAFGNDAIYLEKGLVKPRHVEADLG